MMSSKISILFLIFILIFAFVVRAYNISAVPPGLFCDEAERGVSAYSLIQTGRDWHGQPTPIFFESFGDYVPPLQTYSAMLFVNILGLNELSVRLPSAIWGTAAVLFIFALGTSLFSPAIGLWSAFFLAIQPWTVHYSRFGVEFMIYLALFLLALTLSLRALQKENLWPLALLSWALTFYTYQPAKLITPLFLMSFFLINSGQIKLKTKPIQLGLIIFAIASLPWLFHMMSGAGFNRFHQVSIFSTDKTIRETVSIVSSRYIMQFSPVYLFLRGDPTFITRHLTNGLTPLLKIQAFLVPFGVVYFLRNRKSRQSLLLFSWAMIYPIAGAITASGPLSSRSIIGAPLFALLSGCGIILIVKWFTRQRQVWITVGVTASLLVLILINFFSFYIFYLNEYPKRSADFWGWQYGPREIITYFQQVENQYDELIMSDRFNEPEIFFKFYAPKDCQNCKIGNITSIDPNKKQLLALPPEELLGQTYEVKKLLYYPNGQISFKIVELNK